MKYLYFSDPSIGRERGFYSAFTDNYFFSHKVYNVLHMAFV